MAEEAKDGRGLGELLSKNPEVLSVLHKHGVNFCAGCFITLFADPAKAASYHAVPDIEAFLSDLKSVLGSSK